MTTPDHWKRNPQFPDRESRTRKAEREMLLFALQTTPRRRWIRRLWVWWRLRRCRRAG